MVIMLLDVDVLQLLRMKQASGDFEKTFAAVEEFRLIEKSSGGKGTLRQMRENDDEPEEPDHSDDDQWAVEATVAMNSTTRPSWLPLEKAEARDSRACLN